MTISVKGPNQLARETESILILTNTNPNSSETLIGKREKLSGSKSSAPKKCGEFCNFPFNPYRHPWYGQIRLLQLPFLSKRILEALWRHTLWKPLRTLALSRIIKRGLFAISQVINSPGFFTNSDLPTHCHSLKKIVSFSTLKKAFSW